MRAAILAVGSELLGADRLDTNSLQLAGILARFGIPVGTKSVVGDEAEIIGSAVERLMNDHDLVLITGGLGPTQDDLTREAVGAVLGRSLVRSEEVLGGLRRKFASYGLEMAPVNEKQADVIEGAHVLENRRGTAPGLRLELDSATLYLFPGVPHELEGLVETSLVPWLEERTGGATLETVVLKVACVPESSLEQRLQPFYANFGEDGVSLLPSVGEVSVRLTARGTPDQRSSWLAPRTAALMNLVGEKVFSESSTTTLEEAVGSVLTQAGLTVATAESCTGGLVAERLTRTPGSSAYFLGSIVSYANEVKIQELEVSETLLRERGAVSKEVAIAMATGLGRRIRSDVAIAVTGIAGPEGGTEDKPVGTVHVAICRPKSGKVQHRALLLPGDRSRVRWMTSQWALEMTRRLALAGIAEKST